MRKLMSKKDEAKKQKRNQYILGIILVVVMFGSVFGVIAGSFNSDNKTTQEKITYKGLAFDQQGSFYTLSIGERIFYFSEDPRELDSLNYDFNMTSIITKLVGQPLYLDSEDYYVSQEIAQNVQAYPSRMQSACINEDDCYDELLPIKDCSNNMIIVKESSENKIYEEDNCIFIEGKSEDLMKLADIVILQLLGLN
ncbi:MAG: hypothetical protein PF542_01455 [Nanoarchaeota archaeon]|jgi:hypothetical protein|nr:hypothetical protein [Nanoarchaeota archaeon]